MRLHERSKTLEDDYIHAVGIFNMLALAWKSD
jgi:hypothetical protein